MSQITEAEALAILEQRVSALEAGKRKPKFSRPIPPKAILPTEPSLAQIIWAVAHVTGIEEYQILSMRKADGVARARRLFYVAARNLTSQSFPQIGRFCRKNHATVIHGCQMAAERYMDYRDELAAIERVISRMGSDPS